MANVFQIPIINPFRFVNANAYAGINPRYNSLPFDLKKDGAFNPNGFYSQKWQINDITAFQFNSDFDNTNVTFKIYKFDIGRNFYDDTTAYKTIGISAPAVTVSGVTWKVYECSVDFSTWAEGVYVGVLSYIDQNLVRQNYQTSPLDVRTKQAGTLLYEYSSTYNNKGIVWATGIQMSFRIEGLIREFSAKSLAEEYIDQKYNTYSLNDIPYRTFKNYIGTAKGLPDWAIDKMNVIFTVNLVGIDGTGYAKVIGQSFVITRPEKGYNEDGYAEIDIIPNENFNLEEYNTGTPPNGTVKVVAEVLQFYGNTTDLDISGIFKTHTNLVGIALWNKSLAPFVMKVGTTNGGNEIGQYNVTNDITSYIEINKVFQAATDVFITGLAGITLDMDVRYDDYDAPNSGGGGANTGGFVPNVEYTYYEDVVGDFIRDWDYPTGMGNVGTDFENCFMLDGQNNTLNDAYLFRMGLDKTVPALRQTIVGNAGNQLMITRAELPAEGLNMFTTQINGTAGQTPNSTDPVAYARSVATQALNYEVLKGTIPPTVGVTGNMGSGNPMDITPESLVVVRFIYRKP